MQWQQAVERAYHIASVSERSLVYPANNWDDRAVCGVLTVVVAALAERHDVDVVDVPLGSVLWHLEQGPDMVYELGQELGLDVEGADEPAAGEWAWLTRRWPAQPPLANSGGVPRGIGRGSELPAVEVCTRWAASAAIEALTAERPAGYRRGTRVLVTGGDFEGRTGTAMGAIWLLDDALRTVPPGPPHGYEVRLDAPGSPGGPPTVALEGELGEDLTVYTSWSAPERVEILVADMVATE
ncbi:hypothetical protein ACH4PU_32250 [Streptomyces sp. NPDC021100]|uniref:hypothetical protein n=1 Tax=Streptomyces sp. NPDC021100 TaxID=3365114 RepID=UPI0037B3DF38